MPRIGTVPRLSKRADTVLVWTVSLALLIHAVSLFSYVVLGSGRASPDSFFSGHAEPELQQVTRVELPAPKAVPVATPIPLAPPAMRSAPRVVIHGAPAAHPAGPPRPQAHPRPAAAPPAVIAVDAPAAAPRAEVASTSAGTMSTGRGDGIVRGGGGGRGDGEGSGPPGNGSGGGDRGGRPAPGGGIIPRATMWAHMSLQHVGIEDLVTRTVNVLDEPEPYSWEDLCTLLGMERHEVFQRPFVSAFITRWGYIIPSTEDYQGLVGQRGTVSLEVSVNTRGVPTPRIVVPSGNAAMDRTAMYILGRSHWLPSINRGTPVEQTLAVTLRFDDEAGGAPRGMVIRAAPPRSQPIGGAPVSVPGGAGQAPTGMPGGAGQRPGSW